MVTCFGCGGSIDVSDRYCRWCGRTFIPDNYGPPPSHNENLRQIPGAGVNGWMERTECSSIGLMLMQGIFHDDEEELNDILDLIGFYAVSTDFNQGY
jgi:hypothetical protein